MSPAEVIEGRRQMNFDLTDEQKLLKEQARRVLEERSSYEHVRSLLDSGAVWDPALWQQMANLGWLGASIAEEFGGLGMTGTDSCVLAEELGRCVAPVPFASSVGLAANAITWAGSREQKARYLPKMASGELIATFALAEGPGLTSLAHVQTRCALQRLSGRKWPVPDAQIAQLAVVVATDPNGAPVLAAVELDQPSVIRTPLVGLDALRSHAAIDFENAPADILQAEDAGLVLAKLLDCAATLTAFEQVGGAEASLEMARSYVLQRHTFGRAVGSYQAVKHRLADMWAGIELARSNAYFAAWALTNNAPELPLAAAAARLSASEAYDFAARENLHLHGGIGYTLEANCHFHYRRARLLAVALGSTDFWSDRLVEQLAQNPVEAP
jgi:alkylation response protein AidB-like acyl-CoA dehydrogenase